MPGSQDYVYDLKSYLNDLNKEYFLLVVDIPKYKNISTLRVNATPFSSLYKRPDVKVLLSTINQVITKLNRIQSECFDLKTTELCNKLSEQKFNFLLFTFNKVDGVIIGVDSMFYNVSVKKHTKIFHTVLATEGNSILDQYKY